MPSQLKSETARINGAKSRGPTSAEGREKSSHNALKHGFTSGSMMVLDCENPDRFHELLDTFFNIYQPANLAEEDLVEEMVAARWRIRRMWTIEANLFNDEVRTKGSKTGSTRPGVHLAVAFRSLADDSHSLSLANRYESPLQRIYDRAYRTLRELQHFRQSATRPEADPPTAVTPIAPEPIVASPNIQDPTSNIRSSLPNEPTAAATKEVTDQPANQNPAAAVPPATPELTPQLDGNPTSEIRNPA